MSFLLFVVLVVIAYFVWRIVDQLPDIVYRLSEIQRDVAEVRRWVEQAEPDDSETAAPNAEAASS